MSFHPLKFVIANTQENVDLLNELSNTWTFGHETMVGAEIEFDDPEECARVKDEMSKRSSRFAPV